MKAHQRQQRVAEYYLAGRRQADIALQLGVDQATISRDLTALRKLWQAEAVRNVDEAKAQELARIDRLEREYWKAWRRSLKKATSTSKKLVDVPTKEGTQRRAEASSKEEERLGDPRFLEGVRWCIDRRSQILGIDAPKKQELSGKDGAPITVRVVYVDGD